jgi:hypothetical protein
MNLPEARNHSKEPQQDRQESSSLICNRLAAISNGKEDAKPRLATSTTPHRHHQ